MNQEMLETLIGKYIDSEITPAEQRLLDEEMMDNPQARLMLQQFQQMHEQSRQLLTQEILPASDSPETVFNQALATEQRAVRTPNIFRSRWSNLAASVAAALLVGLLGYAIYINRMPQPIQTSVNGDTKVAMDNSEVSENSTAVALADAENELPDATPRLLRDTNPSKFSHLPDVIVYTDTDGSQWMLEVVPENDARVQTLAYQGDI